MAIGACTYALVGAGCGTLGDEPARTSGPEAVRRVHIGRGATGAQLIFRGSLARSRRVVVFLHGWGIYGPRAYRGWMNHLARQGNVVILPRYQSGLDQAPEMILDNAVAGIRGALERMGPASRSMVLAGHSVGGALAADIAAVASERGLPAPRAVFAVSPGRALKEFPQGVPEIDPAAIPSAVRLVALASEQDTVVGERPARDLVQRAVAVPEAARTFVSIPPGPAADHYAAALDTPPARATFWRRLDGLLREIGRG